MAHGLFGRARGLLVSLCLLEHSPGTPPNTQQVPLKPALGVPCETLVRNSPAVFHYRKLLVRILPTDSPLRTSSTDASSSGPFAVLLRKLYSGYPPEPTLNTSGKLLRTHLTGQVLPETGYGYLYRLVAATRKHALGTRETRSTCVLNLKDLSCTFWKFVAGSLSLQIPVACTRKVAKLFQVSQCVY